VPVDFRRKSGCRTAECRDSGGRPISEFRLQIYGGRGDLGGIQSRRILNHAIQHINPMSEF
jgi:hypothetical protein